MGMTAMQVQGDIAYRPEWFSILVVIALTAAPVALWLAVNLKLLWQRIGAALVMAVAICGMHYSGMMGTMLIALPVYDIAPVLVSKSVLVAEDNPVNQKVLRTLMAGQGHDLTFVDDGLQALDAVRSGSFDLVLMDVSMPVLDGPGATVEIRKLPGAASRIPIIALTANAMAGDREAYLAVGMTGDREA